MNKGIKLRIYPNKYQKQLIEQTFGCTRFVYNAGLALREKAFNAGASLKYKDTSSMLTCLKKQDAYSYFYVM